MATGGRVRVYIEGDADSLVRATGTAQRAISKLHGTTSTTTASTREQTTATQKVGTAFSGAAKSAAKFAATSVGLTSVAVAVRQIATNTVDFDRGMRNVNSIAQLSEKQLGKLSDQVLALAGPTAQAPSTLADGLYDLVSSGFKANDAVKVLGVSAKAATAGLTDTATSTKALAAVLNAYRLNADDAAGSADTLFQTVNRGVITFDELSTTIGDALPFAASLGVNLNDVGAAISTMTKEGLSGSEATTRLKNVLVSFTKPSADLSNAMKDLGYESGQAMIKQLGLEGSLIKLSDATHGSQAEMAKLFPNIRSLGGALALTGKNTQSAKDDLQAFADTSGATDRALSQQSKSIAYQWNKLKAEASALSIRVGQSVIQMVSDFKKFWESSQAARDIVGVAFGKIAGVFKDLLGVIKPTVQTIAAVLTGDWGEAWDKVKDLFRAGKTVVLDVLKAMTAPFRAAANVLGDVLPNVFSGAWDKIKGIFEDGKNALIGVVNWIISNVINRIPGVELGTIGGSSSGATDPGNQGGPGPQHHFSGGKITKPTAIVGEEAPIHPEYVIATNPKYRMRNLQLWHQAGHDIGIPGFAQGGVVPQPMDAAGAVAGAASQVARGPGYYLGKLAGAPFSGLPGFMAGTGDWVKDRFADFIRDKVTSVADIVTSGMTSAAGSPGGVGSFMGVPMANWVISSLKYAQSKGVAPQPTSGYRSHAYNVAQGRNYFSEHEGTVYPHGAVDYGGYHDATAYANKMAIVHATAGYKWPLLAPIGFVDDGHASGTGHAKGGVVGKASGHPVDKGAGFGFSNISTFNANQATTLASVVGMPNPSLMGAIAMAESNGVASAVGDGGSSFGLWQIHTPAWPMFSASKLRDPLYNARAAKYVLDHQGLGAWSTYNNGAYQAFLGGQVMSGGASTGGGSGSSGGHSSGGHSQAPGPDLGSSYTNQPFGPAGQGYVNQPFGPSGQSYNANPGYGEQMAGLDYAGAVAATTSGVEDDRAVLDQRAALLIAKRQRILAKLAKKGLKPKERKRLLEELASVQGDINSVASSQQALYPVPDLGSGDQTDTAAADAAAANAAALQANTDALNAIKDELAKQNALIGATMASDYTQALAYIGDLLSGAVGGLVAPRLSTAGAGSVYRS